MHARYILSIIMLLCLSSLAWAQSDGASLDERTYGIYVPDSYDEDGDDERPLVIALHGFGDTWRNFFRGTGLIQLADAENVIVAFPQGYLRQWNDGSVGDHYEDDVQLLRDLVDRVDRDFRVDRERIYLIGFSNGGTMVYRAACEASDLFAGVAAVAGTMRLAQGDDCENVQMPVAIIHDVNDRVVPFTGEQASRYPVPAIAEFWASRNDCALEEVMPFDQERINTGLGTYFFTNCPDGNIVLMHVLAGNGHIWPGARSYVNGTEPDNPRNHTARILWSFFDVSYDMQQQAEISPEATPEVTEAP